MARVYFDKDVNIRWKPMLAPWRSTEVAVCLTPGTALPAGTPIEIPDDLAYTAHHDFMHLQLGPTWVEVPDVEELEEQRATAVAFAPHVENPPVAVELPRTEEND